MVHPPWLELMLPSPPRKCQPQPIHPPSPTHTHTHTHTKPIPSAVALFNAVSPHSIRTIAGATGVAVSLTAPISSMRRRRRVGSQPSLTASSRCFGSMSWASTSGGHGRHSSSMSRQHVMLPLAVRGRRPGRRRRLRWPSGATARPTARPRSRKHRAHRPAKMPGAPRPSQRPSGRSFRDGRIGTWHCTSFCSASQSLHQASLRLAPKYRQKAVVRPARHI